MSGTAEVLLGVIAVAVAVMAIVQVGAIVAALRVARRVEQLAADMETTVKPLIANLTTVSAEVSRVASLATSQMERADRVFSEFTARVDKTLAMAQQVVTRPARDSAALIAGAKAALAALKSMREATRRRSAGRAMRFEEEEESLFIG